MIDAGWAIPRGTDVPFHVGIVGEKLALRAECDVILITETSREEFPLLALRICPANPSTRRHNAHGVTTGVPHAGQEVIFLEVAWHQRFFWIRQLRVIAADNVKAFPVR